MAILTSELPGLPLNGDVFDCGVDWAARVIWDYMQVVLVRPGPHYPSKLCAEAYDAWTGVVRSLDSLRQVGGLERQIGQDPQWVYRALTTNINEPLPFYAYQTIAQAAVRRMAPNEKCSFYWDRSIAGKIYVARNTVWGADWESIPPDLFVHQVEEFERHRVGMMGVDSLDDYAALGRELELLRLP